MTVAILLRHMTMGNEAAVWNTRWMCAEDYFHIHERFGVGVVAVLDKTSLATVAPLCDGLIVPGSATDIPPAYYGGAPLEKDPPVDEYALDAAAIKTFFEADKPILGLCGGHQAINVFLGGGMRRMADSKAHENDPDHKHPIHIVKGSFIHDAFGVERCTVNSYHAWEVYGIAPDLEVVATTDDGVVEAFESKKHRIFGTQWHPEISLRGDRTDEWRIFENFFRKCEEHR